MPLQNPVASALTMTWLEKISALEAVGWSLTAIANAIGSSPSAISELKQGRTSNPRYQQAVQLDALYRRECENPSDA